jgi:hypothetical protein
MSILTWIFVAWKTGKEFAEALIQRKRLLQQNPTAQLPPVTIMYMNIFYQGVVWPAFWIIQGIERYTVNKYDSEAPAGSLRN